MCFFLFKQIDTSYHRAELLNYLLHVYYSLRKIELVLLQFLSVFFVIQSVKRDAADLHSVWKK